MNTAVDQLLKNIAVGDINIAESVSKINKTSGLAALSQLEKTMSNIDAFMASDTADKLGRGMGEVLPLYTVTCIDHRINSAELSLRQRRAKPSNRKA